MLFCRNRRTIFQILSICQIIEGIRAKNLETTLLLADFSKVFECIQIGKMEQILLAYGLCKETITAIMKAMVCSLMMTLTSLTIRMESGRRYITTISVYNLSRLRTINVYRSHKRKWSYTNKSQKQKISRRNHIPYIYSYR